MTALAPIHAPGQDLPGLIERAASMLSGAKSAAEVLEVSVSIKWFLGSMCDQL